jgi:hypothetical protein
LKRILIPTARYHGETDSSTSDGRDQSIPMVASATWGPNPTVKLSVFAGMELNGTVTLKNALDELVAESSYDPAPLFGVSFEFRFYVASIACKASLRELTQPFNN